MKTALSTVVGSGGFGNRLYAWECLYEIAKINDAEIECNWKELEHIELPNTKYKSNFEEYKSFNSNDLENNSFILDKQFNYKEISGFSFNRYFNKIHIKNNSFPKKYMKLKDDKIINKIKHIIANNNVIGVHVRKRDISMVGQDIPESWYLSLMNEVVSFKNDVKFYISSDVSEKDLQSFYINFDCLNYKDILPHIDKIVFPDDGSPQLDTDLAGLIDFFSLAETKMLICSISTWSMNAYQMNHIPIIFPKEKRCNYQPLENSIVQYKDSDNEKKLTINDIFL